MSPPISPAALPSSPRRTPQVSPSSPRRDPRNHVQMFAAVSPREVANEPARNENGASASWFEDPIALGTLLIVLPPIGLAVVWSSKRYGTDARWALTVMTALMMCIFGAIVVAVMALRG